MISEKGWHDFEFNFRVSNYLKLAAEVQNPGSATKFEFRHPPILSILAFAHTDRDFHER